jgi:TPR repeat protein
MKQNSILSCNQYTLSIPEYVVKRLVYSGLCCLVLSFIYSSKVNAQTTEEITSVLRTLEKSNSPSDRALLAQALRLGDGIEQNHNEALKLSQQSLVAKSPLGMYVLGDCYMYGCGTSKNKKKALAQYKSAFISLKLLADSLPSVPPKYANTNVGIVACYALATMYENGHGIEQREDSAQHYYTIAANYGYAPSMLYRGAWTYYKAENKLDSSAGIAMIKQSAEKSYFDAMVMYATIISTGDSSSQVESLLWMKKAAQFNHPKAQYATGGYYYAGVGTRRDTAQSLLWFKKSAEQGYKPALAELCFRSITGVGVPKNNVSALKYGLACLALCSYGDGDLQILMTRLLDSLSISMKTYTDALPQAIEYANSVVEKQYGLTESGRTVSLLAGDSRKIWKSESLRPVVIRNIGSQPNTYSKEILGFARNGNYRQSVKSPIDTSIQEFEWESENGNLVLKNDTSTILRKVLLMSPGLLILAPTEPLNSVNASAYILAQYEEAKNIKDFNTDGWAFGMPRMKIKKVETTSDQTRISYSLRNLPEEGVNVSVAGFAVSDKATDPELEIESSLLQGAIGDIFESGEKNITWQISRQPSVMKLRAQKASKCALFIDYAWTSEGVYQRLSEKVIIPLEEKPIEKTTKKQSR